MLHSYRVLTVLIILFLSNINLFPQSSNWKDYTNSNQIEAIAAGANYIWVGTSGGLVRLDNSTYSPAFYNKDNSGILSNSVEYGSMAIDKNGNIWIGVTGGLAEYNGSTWTKFDSSNTGLTNLVVDYIYPDNLGNIWIGTYFGGLVKYDGKTWTADNTLFNGTKLSVFYITQDKSGNMWVGTENGLAVNKNGTWTVYNTNNSLLPGNVVTSIDFDSSGSAWISTNFGIAKFNGTNWTAYTTANSGLSGQFIQTLKIDSQNHIWIATANNGIDVFDGTNWTNYTTSNSGLPSNEINVFYFDPTGAKWIGTFNGLVKFDGTNWTKINTANSGIPNGEYGTTLRVGPLFVDNQNNLWAGGTYLIKFDGKNWTQFDPFTQTFLFSPNNVTSVTVDNSGTPWILSTNSVYYLTGNKWNFITSSLAGFSGYINFNTITIDGAGNKWIGTQGGLAKYNDTSWTIYTTQNSQIPTNSVSSLVWYNNSLWMGSNAGLLNYDGNNWKSYTPALGSSYTYNLVIDSSGNKWSYALGGYSNIFFKFDGSTWTEYIAPDSITAMAVYGSNIWIGTGFHGLYKFDGTNWTVYNTSNSGLSNNDVSSIIIDKLGNIWLTTSGDDIQEFNPNGIVTSVSSYSYSVPANYRLFQNYPNPFNPSTIIEYSIPRAEHVTLKIYDVLGREVTTLVDENKAAGTYSVQFNSQQTTNNKQLSSGIYFYRITAGSFIAVKKLMLLK